MAVPFVAALVFSACGEAVSDEQVIDEPVALEEIKGTELSRITLTPKAAERLGIQTAPVATAGKRLVLPAAAVFVDPNGVFWVYTNPKPLVFARHRIKVDYEGGDRVFVSEGPRPGTRVVTVGVPELYGAESEIGH